MIASNSHHVRQRDSTLENGPRIAAVHQDHGRAPPGGSGSGSSRSTGLTFRTLLADDFYEIGDLLDVVDVLNGMRPGTSDCGKASWLAIVRMSHAGSEGLN